MKPWYKVITPREDLREGRPLDASEFAVHLDHVRAGKAPADYQDPARFFERTFLTRNLKSLASEVLRRLAGVTTETSAVFNMSTQFGGGKTHALTLLYHLSQAGGKATSLTGVSALLQETNLASVPACKTAVFVGTEFDALTGRGGNDGTPIRKTPWGEIAWQLGGTDSLAILAEHEKQMIAPAGDVLERVFPKETAVLILMDEIMNFVSRSPKKGMGNQFYNFLHNLSEFARSRPNVVLAVSVPASELEMNAADQADFERIKKLLDRLGKAVIMSVESETSEIIRRRLFEWGQWDGLKKEAKQTAQGYADWILAHRQQIPQWFPIDHAVNAFEASYPFHPSVLSVFERKWQALSRFQRTRGILRILALWVSNAYQQGFKKNLPDLLIGLGTAPLEDSQFRTALFEQLGEMRLEGAVTTDICGKIDSHAVRLDKEAEAEVKRVRLHQKIATSIFFESNGGQTQTSATVPEICLAVAEIGLNIGNVETALDAISSASYFLTVDGTKYRFSLSPNLNKLLADRRASVANSKIKERIRAEIQKVFAPYSGIERKFFPEKSNDVPDCGVLTFVILAPEDNLGETETTDMVGMLDRWTRQCGNGMRRFKTAPVWVVADTSTGLQDEARKLLAWEEIKAESASLRLDDLQLRQLEENLKKSQRDLNECVWRTYKHLMYLGKNGEMRTVDLGLVHSSAADTLIAFYLTRLQSEGEIVSQISPSFLTRNWPPALTEWATKAIKEVFFATPEFPRLLKPDEVLKTLALGISDGRLAYVGKNSSGEYEPFYFNSQIDVSTIEISDEMYIIRKETAEAYLKSHTSPSEPSLSVVPVITPTPARTPREVTPDSESESVHHLTWSGKVTSQEWMNFYTKVLGHFVTDCDVTLTCRLDILSQKSISPQQVEDANVAIREMGLEGELINESS